MGQPDSSKGTIEIVNPLFGFFSNALHIQISIFQIIVDAVGKFFDLFIVLSNFLIVALKERSSS